MAQHAGVRWVIDDGVDVRVVSLQPRDHFFPRVIFALNESLRHLFALGGAKDDVVRAAAGGGRVSEYVSE